MTENVLNVFGMPLEPCCYDPMTGYFRDGFCKTMDLDTGTNVVCARVTTEFLAYSKEHGNDLITPIPESNFRGLNLVINGVCVSQDGLKQKKQG